jgi:hypothetical protein
MRDYRNPQQSAEPGPILAQGSGDGPAHLLNLSSTGASLSALQPLYDTGTYDGSAKEGYKVAQAVHPPVQVHKAGHP